MVERRKRTFPRRTGESLIISNVGNNACNIHFSAFSKNSLIGLSRLFIIKKTAVLSNTQLASNFIYGFCYPCLPLYILQISYAKSFFFPPDPVAASGRNPGRLKKVRTQLIHSICLLARPMDMPPV